MSNSENLHNNDIFEIKADNQKKILSLYNEHKASFIKYSAKNFNLPSDKAEDIYQEAFLALHQNVKNERLTNLTVPLRTYLFQIGKNKIYDYFKKTKNEVKIEKLSNLASTNEELGDFSLVFIDEESSEEQKRLIVYNVVSLLESPCKEVLSYYYWKNKSMKEIAELMNYNNSDVAKTQKSRCVKKIKNIIIERFRKADLI